MEGIRDRLYGFVKFCPRHVVGEFKGEVKTDMAMDISFGSSGYALVLARAFKTVSNISLKVLDAAYTDEYNIYTHLPPPPTQHAHMYCYTFSPRLCQLTFVHSFEMRINLLRKKSSTQTISM